MVGSVCSLLDESKNKNWLKISSGYQPKKSLALIQQLLPPHKLLWSLMDSENITYIKFFIKPSINALLHTSTTQYQP